MHECVFADRFPESLPQQWDIPIIRARAGLSKTAMTSLQPEWLLDSVPSSDFDQLRDLRGFVSGV